MPASALRVDLLRVRARRHARELGRPVQHGGQREAREVLGGRHVLPQLEHLLEVAQRLAEAGQRLRVARGVQRCSQRLHRLAGRDPVLRQLTRDRATRGQRGVLRQGARKARVELLPLAGQQRVVDGLGEQRVTEAEAAVRLIRHQDVLLDGLAQRLGDGALRRVHHDGQQPVRDVPAGGGDDAQYRSGVCIEAGDGGDQQVMQRRREVVLAARGGRRELDREERVAFRASAHRCRQLGGQRFVDARGDEGLDVLVCERPELDRDGASGPAKPGAEAVQRMLGRDRVAAVGRDDEHAAPLDRVREVGDEIERRSVGPVQILEQQNNRSAPADVLEDGEHLGEQTQPRRGSVAVRGERGAVGEVGMQARQLVQLAADLAELGRAAERAERLDEREIGQARADEVDAAAAEDRRPLAARPGCELRGQDGLADPRRADDQRGRAEAPGGRLEGHVQPLQLVGAPDEHVRPVVVGPVTGRAVADGEADRPTLCAVVAWAQVERRILVEHLALEVVERRGRFQPELLLQRRAELVVDRERLGRRPAR